MRKASWAKWADEPSQLCSTRRIFTLRCLDNIIYELHPLDLIGSR